MTTNTDWSEAAKDDWWEDPSHAPTHVVVYRPTFRIPLTVVPWAEDPAKVVEQAVAGWGERLPWGGEAWTEPAGNEKWTHEIELVASEHVVEAP